MAHGDYGMRVRARLPVRYAFFGSVLAFVTVLALAILVDAFYARTELWMGLALFAWIAVLATGLFLHNSKCPRCGNRFAVHESGMRYNTFTLTCLTCGLPSSDSGTASSNHTVETDARKSGARGSP